MKTSYYIVAAFAVLTFTYCKTSKPVAAPAPTPAPVAITPPASDANIPTLLQTAEKRWPGTSEAELGEGKTIYTTKCTRCHKAYKIEEFGEKKWLHEIDDMSPKAKLTPDEKTRLTKYILSYRELKEMATAPAPAKGN